jgi:plasmid stabilization system protein ParE
VAGKKIEFHDEAAAEYDASFDWYLGRSPDAARNFDSAVEDALSQIRQAPLRWASGPFNTRRYLLQRFPFLLIYREQSPDEIQIIAVAHTSRRPAYWKTGCNSGHCTSTVLCGLIVELLFPFRRRYANVQNTCRSDGLACSSQFCVRTGKNLRENDAQESRDL